MRLSIKMIQKIRKVIINFKWEDYIFFSGSIKENLQFANEHATYEEIIEVCKQAQIHDFINWVSLRYETPLQAFILEYVIYQLNQWQIKREIV